MPEEPRTQGEDWLKANPFWTPEVTTMPFLAVLSPTPSSDHFLPRIPEA